MEWENWRGVFFEAIKEMQKIKISASTFVLRMKVDRKEFLLDFLPPKKSAKN